ncbi:Uncharacterised protein [Nocardia otitidiscaviarum]|uniref:Uncharacterized protein n=1 Tax=Nocardia otitidiscaviarum TaxID=1823 RepID=A0A378YFH2_9NOCA|nr:MULTISPECIES: hypothetical protein [Nocardia]MCP9621502.1 hypothetical protein [Nocardia otitidiscaviarum]QDP82188.1 hypothetical protein FOH10_29110 [Nocardia otitidiscaviarum]SUA75608.1 Uncharacterised protein [Nocardia otitidiscaviarum]
MLVPGLTVTAIGLVVAVAAGVVLGHGPVARSVAGGLIGGWLGFAAGAGIGWLVDSALPAPYYGTMFGHALAVLGALAFVTRPFRSGQGSLSANGR